MEKIINLMDLMPVLPSCCRMPQDDKLHLIAKDYRYLNFFRKVTLYPQHISYFVIKPVQLHLLKNEFLKSVQIVVIEGIGVILTSSCSSDSESILKRMVCWAPYISSKSSIQCYSSKVERFLIF
jgi:hypothetical protein